MNGGYELTFLIETAIAGDSQRKVNLYINSEVPEEFRLSDDDISVSEAGAQWIPKGVARP